jgi:2-polyprenyl-6-methoxyphenol hydroxylase-like FAD-dependent oxidoreductase
VVLEQSDRLRAEGTSITLWTNAMKALELLDIADQLRNTYINVLGVEYLNYLGKRLTILDYSTCEGGPHEMRCVERKVLLEALAAQIPKGTIRLNSQVTSIKKSETSPNFTDLELQDGSTYSAKVVVGFDGVNSIVGSWLGLKKPNSVGQLEIRGMAEFPNAHNFSNLFRIFYGNQVVIGFNSMTPTKVFWLLIWTDWSEGWRNTTPEQIKLEALEHAKDFQVPELQLCINNTALEHFTKNTIRQRINEKSNCDQVVGNVTVCGDASHPTTPSLGQGGCMALEDGIILARKLHQTFKSKESQISEVPEHERIHQTLLDFHQERYPRTNALTRKAAMVGSSVTSNTFIKRFLRDWFFIPRGVHAGNYMEDTLFDVGNLKVTN